MGELLLISLGAALVNNLALVELLGAGVLLRSRDGVDAAVRFGALTGIVIVVAVPVARLVERELLRPLDLPHLRLVALVAVAATTAAVVRAGLQRIAPDATTLRDGLAFGLNGAVLGAVLLNTAASRGILASLFYAGGTALGFTVVLVLFAGLRERLAHADVPLAFRGPAILFVTAGILSLAFMAFTGFARL